MQTEFMDTREAAAYLGLKKNTLEIWRMRGDGPPFYAFGRSKRYKRSVLDAWIEKQVRTSTSDEGRS